MRSRIIFWGILLVGLVAMLARPAQSADEVLFQDAFTNLSHWNAPEQWRTEGGSLVVTGGDISLCKEGAEWTNYALEFDVVIRKTMAQWVIRAASDKDCIFIQLTASDCAYSPNALRCHRWRNGGLVDIREEVLPFDIEPGKSYHIRCEVVDSTVQTLIDGKVRDRWTFDGYPRGTVGFRSSDTEEAVYKNLKVLRCASLTAPASVTRHKPASKVKPYDPFLNPPFRAEWTWGTGEALDRAFRTSFELTGNVLDSHLWITTDDAFHLFLNGKLVGSGDDWHAPKLFDLKPFLHRGRNVLAVAGHNAAPGAAGVLAEGNILQEDGKNIPLVSGAGWCTIDAPAQGWETPEFDDSAWPRALSEGRHPVEPWGSQSDWALPYLGPMEIAEVESLAMDGSLQAGRPVQVAAHFRLPRAFAHAHPVRLLATLPGGKEVTVAEAYPQPPTTRWAAGPNWLRCTLIPGPRFWLPPGRYPVRLEMPGVFIEKGAEHLVQTLTWTVPPRRQALPLSKRPMGPGIFTDQFGKTHHYRLEEGWLVYDGERLCPLQHGDGVYWCVDDPKQRAAIEACRSQSVLARVRRFGLSEEPVRVRLRDSVECADPQSEAAHEFGDDDGYGGRSRLLPIGGRTYRVTSNRRRLSYFAYTLRCTAPGRPHLLAFETPNDRERYTLVRIQPPWHNVGCGPFTGRDMPCDGRPEQAGFLFYPEDEDIRLTVSRLPCELKIDPESGGAVSRLWLFEVVDNLSEDRAEVAPAPGLQRHIGLSLTHPAYLYDLYGFHYGDITRRLASLNAFADYAEFVGMNHLEFNAINGADTSEVAYYPSKIWPEYHGDADLFHELLPIAEERGLSVIPCLTSLAFDIDRFTNAPWISPLTFQIDKDGFSSREFFRGRGNDNTAPDPLRPEVQQYFLNTLREFGERCKASPAVTGLAFRLNGKIGTCYVGYNEQETAETAGFSPWDLSEFQKETGVHIPGWDEGLVDRWVAAWKSGKHDDPAIRFIPTTYDWMRSHCWKEWTDWRCRRMADLWRRARDLARSYRLDWNLVVKCDMPSETPDRNILWPAGASPLDLFRSHGFDPHLVAKQPDILLQQGYFLGGGEYFHSFGPGNPLFKNPEAWTAFDYQPGLADLYRTQAGASVEFYNNYWEENGAAPMGEFGTSFWGAGMMYPHGRWFFRPMLHALRTANVRTMALFSWERGSEGHEGDLRRFCRAFRALPAVAPESFAGGVTVTSGPAADDTLWVRRFGSRIALVNESPQARTVHLHVPVGAGQGVYEYASERRLGKGPGPVTVEVEMDPFDLRVVGAE